MSNALSISNASVLAELSDLTSTIPTMSYDKLKYADGQFTANIGGVDVELPPGKLPVTIVTTRKTGHRIWYAKSWQEHQNEIKAGTADPGEPNTPSCWSEDEIMPHPDSPNRQAASCAKCPRAAKENGYVACARRFRIVVMLNEYPDSLLTFDMSATSRFGENDEGNKVLNWSSYMKLVQLLMKQNTPLPMYTTYLVPRQKRVAFFSHNASTPLTQTAPEIISYILEANRDGTIKELIERDVVFIRREPDVVMLDEDEQVFEAPVIAPVAAPAPSAPIAPIAPPAPSLDDMDAFDI